MTLARLSRQESRSGRPERIRVTDLSEEVMEERWVREAAEVGKIDERVVADEVPCAVVAVSPASGISRIFHSLGVQELVLGGQSMNPSTSELLDAVERAPGEEVLILPNNSNIVAVAQAVDAETEKTVVVIPTTRSQKAWRRYLDTIRRLLRHRIP